jgi:hypothetical protein
LGKCQGIVFEASFDFHNFDEATNMKFPDPVVLYFWFASIIIIFALACECARFYRNSKLKNNSEIQERLPGVTGEGNTNIRYLKRDADVDTTESIKLLKNALNKAENNEFEAVVVIALNKGGTQWFKSTNMSQYEKSFLLTFYQAIVTDWFQLGGWNE